MAVRSNAITGAGAAGAAAAAALKAEDTFKTIKVFERRSTAGGTWIYDAEPKPIRLYPGALPHEIDQHSKIPTQLPAVTRHEWRQRYEDTPIYKELTTNVPDMAMCFTDSPFAYGPFVRHTVPQQYIENYFSLHRLDSLDTLILNTTVEDLRRLAGNRWKVTLR